MYMLHFSLKAHWTLLSHVLGWGRKGKKILQPISYLLPLISTVGSNPLSSSGFSKTPLKAASTLLILGKPIIHLPELLQRRDILLGSK